MNDVVEVDDVSYVAKRQQSSRFGDLTGRVLGVGVLTVAIFVCLGLLVFSGDGSRYTLEAPAKVRAVAFNPDGSMLASGDGGTIKLRSPSSGEEIRTLGSHEALVIQISFSPDASLLASRSSGGEVKVWDVETGKETRTLVDHSDDERGAVAVRGIGVAFGPDGLTVATARDDSVSLWDVNSGTELHTLSDLGNPVNNIAFHPDGSMLVVATGGVVIGWDVETGEELRSYKTLRAEEISFSPDGSTFVAGASGGDVTLWNVETGEELHRFDASGELQPWVDFSPGGRTIFIGGTGAAVHLRDAETGETVHVLPVTPQFSGGTYGAFSPDGSLLVTVDKQATTLWDVETGEEVWSIDEFGEWFGDVVFSPDGSSLVVTSDTELVVWDVDDLN